MNIERRYCMESIYTIEEQNALAHILDECIAQQPEQIYLLGEEIAYDIFLEEITGGSIKRAVRNAQAIGHRVDKKASKAVDSTVDAALDGERKAELKSIREDLLRGRGKPSTIIKRAIKAAIAGCAIGIAAGGISLAPFFSLITFIISTIRRRDISDKEKKKIVWEMEQELEIVEEKIKDAESDGNKKLKYQYMRLRSELQRNIVQLKVYGKIQQRDNYGKG